MNRYIFSTFFSVLILFSSIGSGVYAQTNTGPDLGGEAELNSQSETGNTGDILMDDNPPAGQTENTFEPGVGGGPGNTTSVPGSDNGLYWLWLLPLAAIPLLYFVWRSNDEISDSRGYRE